MDKIHLDATNPDQVKKRLTQWIQIIKDRKHIAVYGTNFDLCILFDKSNTIRKKVISLTIEPGEINSIVAKSLLSQHPDFIIVLSRFYQEPILRQLKCCGYKGKVVLPYRYNPRIGTLGLFAYNSSKDWYNEIFTKSKHGILKPRLKSANKHLVLNNNKQSKPRTIRNLLFIQPSFDVANNRHKKSMPLGILYVASMLLKENPNLNISILDAHILDLTLSQTIEEINNRKFDLVGITYWSAQSQNSYMISDYIKKTTPAYIIHGGVHATLCPEESLLHCDAIVPFEGERTFSSLITSINSGQQIENIKGLWLPNKPCDFVNEFANNLDDIPFPAWDLLQDINYYDAPMHIVGGKRFPIVGSRGCLFKCKFCSSPVFWKRKVRWRSPQNVADEMDEIYHRYKINKFHFWDDNMVMNKDYITNLSQELITRNRSYIWCGLSRASDIVKQKAILPLMKKAGCIGIEIGMEGFNDQVSAQMLKGEKISTIEQAVTALHQAGIVPLYTHMLFSPGETINSYVSKELFMRHLNNGTSEPYRSNTALGQLTTPHIKTEFFIDAPNLGQVLWEEPSHSYHQRVNFIPLSLLLDVPRLITKTPPDPLLFLANIIQGLNNWTVQDMQDYIVCSNYFWEVIDGVTSLQDLIELVSIKSGQTLKKATIYCSLAVVGWSRSGSILGEK